MTADIDGMDKQVEEVSATERSERDPFNLVDEPWIPALMGDGSTLVLSLGEVFSRAPNIVRLVPDLPTTTVAIEASLQAILRRALPAYSEHGPWPAAEEVATHYWDDWDMAVTSIRDYLNTWRHRFNLFDPVAPFFQAAGLEKLKGGHDTLDKLIADSPGDEAFLTMRRGEKLKSLSLPEAARWLIHAQAYDPSGIRGSAVGDNRNTGGKVYPTGPGWLALFGVITPRSGALHHDLLLATVPAGVGRLEYDPVEDLPVWERDPLTSRPEGIADATWESSPVKEIRAVRRQPKGPADILTWPARRIRLLREGDRVTGVILAAGDPIDPQNRFTVEPRAAWRFSKPQTAKFKTDTYMPRELPTSSAFWRGVEALFPRSVSMEKLPRNKEAIKFYGPAISSWLAELDSPDALGEGALDAVTFEATGAVLGSNRSTIDDIITDSLTLPPALFAEENLRFRVEIQDWVGRAEKVSSAVAGFAADLARAAGSEDTDGLFQETRADFLGSARIAFSAALEGVDMTSFEETQRAGAEWSDGLRRLAYQQRSNLLEALGTAALIGTPKGDQYLTAGNAERWFSQRIRRILGSPTPKENI